MTVYDLLSNDYIEIPSQDFFPVFFLFCRIYLITIFNNFELFEINIMLNI